MICRPIQDGAMSGLSGQRPTLGDTRLEDGVDPADVPRLADCARGDHLLVVDGFVSASECNTILSELDFALWRPSLTYTKQQSGAYVNQLSPFRVSETAHQRWFSHDLNVMLVTIERRLGELVALDRLHLESWQATRYGPGGKFEYHLDSGYWDTHWAGDRTLSFVLYLDTPEGGGGTDFRALDIHVEATAGRLLMWRNLLPTGHADHRMIHSSTPVRAGAKKTLVNWLRQRPFRRSLT
jgi:prolyl 4-hydroxylase